MPVSPGRQQRRSKRRRFGTLKFPGLANGDAKPGGKGSKSPPARTTEAEMSLRDNNKVRIVREGEVGWRPTVYYAVHGRLPMRKGTLD